MLIPIKFIGEEVEVLFDVPPALSKKPGCPDGFIWQGKEFRVMELLSEWADFSRRGRFARNMQPHNQRKAVRRGSFGVGRYYFQVRTSGDRIFELYYDRAPKGSKQRKGAWFMRSELIED